MDKTLTFLPPRTQQDTAVRVATKNNNSITCQTCFKAFGTVEDLRSHVATFQLETQRLLLRQLEVQAHLPVDESDNESDSDDADHCDDDDDDDDEVEDGNERKVRHQCPKCTRTFNTADLCGKHFQNHVRCLDLCVYCGDTFTRVRGYLRHNCTQRRRKKDAGKESSRKERCSQLRGLAKQKQLAMLARRQIASEVQAASRKRACTEMESPMSPQMSKKRITVNHEDRRIYNEATLSVPTQEDALANRPTMLSSPQFSADASTTGFPISGMTAPIFQGQTIPFYADFSQIQTFAFPPQGGTTTGLAVGNQAEVQRIGGR